MIRRPAAYASAVFLSVLAAAVPAPSRAGEAVGRVFLDADGDGSFSPGDEPLADVPVTDGVGFAATGADGRYALQLGRDPLLGEASGPIVSVCFPSGTWPGGAWFRRLDGGAAEGVDFPLRRREARRPLLLAHGTDPHLPRMGDGKFLAFRKAVAERADTLAFTVITGDCVNLADSRPPAEAAREFAALARLTADFPTPLFLTPGNHDAAGVKAAGKWRPEDPNFAYGHWRRVAGPLRWSFDHGGVHFVGVDFLHVEKGKWVWGVGDSAGAWLEKDLDIAGEDARVVLFVHMPQGTRRFGELLRTRRIEHVFSGHSHAIRVGRAGGKPVSYSGSIVQIYPKKAAQRTGFRLVRVDEDAIRTLYVATGEEPAVDIQAPAPGVKLRGGEEVAGSFLDPTGAAKVAVDCGGRRLEPTVRRGPVFSTFRTRLPDGATGPLAVTVTAAGQTRTVQRK